MRARTALIAGHFATLGVAYVLFELASFFSSIAGMNAKTVVFFLSMVAAMSGSFLLTWKSTNKDRVIYAFSTIMAFTLLIWTLSTTAN